MRILWPLLSCLLLLACGSTPPPSYAKPAPDVAKLTLALPVAWTASVTANDKSTPAQLPSEVREKLEKWLTAFGYKVVLDPSDPHDLDLSLTLTVDAWDTWGRSVVSRGDLVARSGSRDVDHVVFSSESGAVSVFTYPDWVASRIVDGLGRSSRLLAFAQTRGATSVTPATPATASVQAPAVDPTPSFTSAAPQPNAFAVIVGVEKYSGALPPPTGARTDAQSFASLAKSSLGVSPDHVQLVLDDQATKGGVERALAWAQASVPPGGRIYFYFSGHGAPDASAGTSYIVPADGDPKYLDATAISMKDVLSKLGQSKAKEVLAVVDSCFSGAGGRSVLPPGARPLVRVKQEMAPAQLALFSASSGSEISGPVPGGSGGLFTKYVLDGLGSGAADINGDGQVSLGELSQWVAPRVAREAKKDNRDQNPSLTVGKGLGSADGFIVEWGLPAK